MKHLKFVKYIKRNLKKFLILNKKNTFYKNLKGISDPGKKKVIGKTFIKIFEDLQKKI